MDQVMTISTYYIKNLVEFGDSSDWTLSKCLTHANRTFNLRIKSGVQVSIRFLAHLKD